MAELNTNSVISCNGQLTTTGESSGDLYPLGFQPYWDYHNYYYHWHYPQTEMIYQNKIETAFKVVSKLMEEKIIGNLTAKKFAELVNRVSEII